LGGGEKPKGSAKKYKEVDKEKRSRELSMRKMNFKKWTLTGTIIYPDIFEAAISHLLILFSLKSKLPANRSCSLRRFI
jgi:hypothetical protein